MGGFGWDASYLNWFTVGVICIVLEILLPDVFLMWVGFAALATGLSIWLLDLSGLGIWLLFAVYLLLSLALGYHFLRRNTATTAPLLNQRGQQLVGTVVTLDQPVVNGLTSVRIGDSRWQLHLNQGRVGDQVKIIAADNTILLGEHCP